MSEPQLHRPPQATVAGWMVVVGSAVVVLTALDQAAGLRSLDTRESVERYLSQPPGDQLGLSVQGGLTLLRVLMTVTAASAAASAVLGWYALRRSRAARVWLTVIAVPLFVVGSSFQGLVGGGVVPAMVAAAAVILWFQPTRDWYDGKAPAPRPTPPATPTPPPATSTPPPPAPPAGGGRDPLLDLPPPTAPPLYPTAHPAPAQVTSPRARPRTITWACAVTWASTAAVFGLFGVWLLELLVAPGSVVDEVRRQNPDLAVSDSDLRAAILVVCLVAMAWSAAAAGLAVLVWQRVGWAAVALAVSAALACLTLLVAPACIAAGVLLFRPDARAWLRGSRQPDRPM